MMKLEKKKIKTKDDRGGREGGMEEKEGSERNINKTTGAKSKTGNEGQARAQPVWSHTRR
jgi:hypothetical protein